MPSLQQFSEYLRSSTSGGRGLICVVFTEQNKPNFKFLVISGSTIFHSRLETYLKNLAGSTAATDRFTTAYQSGEAVNLRVILLGSFSLESESGQSPTQRGKELCSFVREKVKRVTNTHLPWIRHFEQSGLNCKASLSIEVKNGKITQFTPTGILSGNCETEFEVLDVLARVRVQNDSFFSHTAEESLSTSQPSPEWNGSEESTEGFLSADSRTSTAWISQSNSLLSIDQVADYYARIQHYRVLSFAEEQDYSHKIKIGREAQMKLAERNDINNRGERQALARDFYEGRKSYEQFVTCNLKLVTSIARRFQNRGLEIMDLIQEGNYGLLLAIEKFDHTKGYKFSTYATWWIKQVISRAIADKARLIRLPVHVVEILNRINKFQLNFLLRNQMAPSLEEIALSCELKVTKVSELLDYQAGVLSLDEMLDRNEDEGFLHLLPCGDEESILEEVATGELKRRLNILLASMNEREAFIIRMRFGLDDGFLRTLDEIGEQLGVTRERVRQIENKAMSKLRHTSRTDFLKEFV